MDVDSGSELFYFCHFNLEIWRAPSQLSRVKLNTRRVRDFFANVYFAFFGSLASIVALIWFAFDKLKPWTILWAILVPVAVLCLAGIAIYSIRVRQENIQFRNFTKILHRINHDYRDTLSAVFKNHSIDLSAEDYWTYLKQSERKTLKSSCEKIAKIFTAFTHRPCTVTVKLITQAEGKNVCEMLERSEENSERDTCTPRQFDIGTGANTAFDRATLASQGSVAHFHSADLTAEKDYRNQRDHWSDVYLSTIVVPIRSVHRSKDGKDYCRDDIGFLCVDTLSPHRLNDTWHVELLASFADQMYNYISLMRGNYSLKKAVTPVTAQERSAVS